MTRARAGAWLVAAIAAVGLAALWWRWGEKIFAAALGGMVC